MKTTKCEAKIIQHYNLRKVHIKKKTKKLPVKVMSTC